MKIFLRDLKKKAESYRKENKIPGVIYGPEIEAQPIYVDEKELASVLQKSVTRLEIEFENKKLTAILQEVQIHPVTDKVIHFDLYVPKD